MKNIYTGVFLVLFSIIFLPAALLLAIKEFSFSDQPSLDATQRIFGETIVSQSFVSQDNNLSSLGMSIKNPNLQNREDIILTLFEGGVEKRKVVVSGKNIGDGNFVKFRFTPIDDSKDKKYTFILSAPQTSEDKSLEVFYKGLPSINLNMLINNQPIAGDVSFVSFYHPQNIFSLVGIVYKGWFNKLIADKLFFVTFLAVILILLGFLKGIKFPFNLFSRSQSSH